MKLILVAGARPNFMKIAPIIREIEDRQKAGKEAPECLLVHTGQHYDINMSQVFFKELGIPEPDINLEVGSGSHSAQTAEVMVRFEPVCIEEKPDWVVVVGDVNSTMACTLVAAKMGIRTAHVEAGLRSFDRTMPEEINRLVTDTLADLLFTPSKDGDENLLKEGVAPEKIRFVGNIMIDTLMANLEKAEARKTHRELGVSEKEFVYVTLHRPSNVDHPESLKRIMENLFKLSETLPVIFPIHPRTKKMLETCRIEIRKGDRMKMIEPVGYHDSISLARNARLVLTDSGGLQEETTFFQTPCLTLRPNTERPVTITDGSNRLTAPDRLSEDIEAVLKSPPISGQIPKLWDGRTAGRIIDHLMRA